MSLPPCNIVGATSDGQVTHCCGCVEQLQYETPGFGDPGGWGANWGPPVWLERCGKHKYEDKLPEATQRAKEQAFLEHFGMTREQARSRIKHLRKEIKSNEEETILLQTALDKGNE